jgi:hypothetical protein
VGLWSCRIPGANDGFAVFLFLGQLQVEGEEFFELVGVEAEAVGLQRASKLFVELVKLAVGFVEVGVVEVGDAPRFLRPFLVAVLVRRMSMVDCFYFEHRY